ncbi:MAG TPA: 50S ribosomal protein L11 methyltransferase [Candidatus Binatia bacterium]|nr:50S ribosomal protein L11 methyltransferase [Candidatus Binatia bacterium]
MKQLVASFVLGSAMTVFGTAKAVDSPEEIPFVPTPMEVVEQMLQSAEVRKGHVLDDLGSGDGRIMIRAAKLYGIRAVGVEMDQLRLEKAQKNAKTSGGSHLVEFRAEERL